MKRSNLILVEDDPQQSATIIESIRDWYPGTEVLLCETENDFYRYCKEVAAHPGSPRPDVVVSDVMLPFAFPGDELVEELPEECALDPDAFRKAGVRCWKRSRSVPALRDVPWVYFTVLDPNAIDFENNRDDRTKYIPKAGSLAPLRAVIDPTFLELDSCWSETEEQVTREFEPMHQALIAGRNTPLEECSTVLP